MNDKLDLGIPEKALFRSEVQSAIREVDYRTGLSRFRPSRFYLGRGDLRPLGIDAILHVGYKFGDSHDHKLELLDTGKKSYSDLVTIIEAVTYADPEQLRVMRIDLCADVPGVPVLWFQPRVRVKYKRFANEIGQLKYERIGRGGIETLTAGKRPNLIRIYDKVAESKEQFRKILRKYSRDSESPTFENEFGFPENAIVTRVERQFGGDRIPECLNTFAKLPRAPEFNPFTSIEIIDGRGSRVPTIAECGGLTEWVIGTRYRELRDEMGMQQFRAFLNRHSQGNASRIIEKYSRFFAAGDDDCLDVGRIFSIYRQSAVRQLSA